LFRQKSRPFAKQILPRSRQRKRQRLVYVHVWDMLKIGRFCAKINRRIIKELLTNEILD